MHFVGRTLEKKYQEVGKVNNELRKENIKIYKPISDDMFVQYDLSVKTTGGYNQGKFRYWKSAMIYKLNKRLNVK